LKAEIENKSIKNSLVELLLKKKADENCKKAKVQQPLKLK
jgi:hypothetical protein